MVMEEGKAEIGTLAGLFPAYRAANTHFLHLEEVVKDTPSKHQVSWSIHRTTLPGLQVPRT